MIDHQRKTMPRIQFERIADDVVITRGDAAGRHTSITMPLDQALILADWITAAAEDHQQAVAPEPHPSPDPEPETGEAGGCTRTASIHERVAAELRKLEGRDVSIRTVGRRGPTIVVRDVDSARRTFDCPVIAIADGEVRRA